jgi:hypothetical protein
VQLNKGQNSSTSTTDKILISVEWHIFISHGNGLADGIGKTVKRLGAQARREHTNSNTSQTI